MTSLTISAGVLALTVLGAGLGLIFRPAHHHLDSDSRDTVRSVLGLISTMSAVVLSLLIASAKNTYDAQVSAVEDLASRTLLLDRTLAHYGPEAQPARALLRRSIAVAVDRIWPSDPRRSAELELPENRGAAEAFLDEIGKLRPATDLQRMLQAQAIQITSSLGQTRMLMAVQTGTFESQTFLIVLVAWVVVLFVGFALFSRPNAMVFAALLVGALAVSGAVFLILELNSPYGGLLRIPDTMMRGTLALMGQG